MLYSEQKWRHFYWTLIITFSGLLWPCYTFLPDQDCPEICDCHYFRINWVTDCSETGLTTIPTYDDDLSPNVYLLNLNSNNITRITPFPEDIKLRSLRISGNKLTIITKEEFFGLGYLLDVDLSNNNISYIEPDTFSDTPGLITIELQKNHFDRIEGPFLITKSLLNLDISDCQLNYLNPFFFTDTPALNYIDLSGNPIGEITNNIFDRIISLHVLKLNRCKLTSISVKAFERLEDLKKLELSDNLLTSPLEWSQIFAPLSRLEYLDLSRSGITDVPDNLFEKNIWLRSLILADNSLNNVDVATMLGTNVQNLDLLDLSGCSIQTPLSIKSFANATNLRTLILSGNVMSDADLEGALSPLTNLQKLSLRNCSLTRLPANTFHKFADLRELDLSLNPLNNAFTELLNPLESLVLLDMGYSNLSYISMNTFSKMISLKTLILSGNPLKNLESGLFKNLTDLRRIDLRNCGISGLNKTVFHETFTYPSLEELYLSDNPLEIPTQGSFLPKQLSQLKILDLSRCNISYIPVNALDSFSDIIELYLEGNRLSYENDTELDFLKKLPFLKKLDLSNNQLKLITPHVFQYNTELTWLKLEGNPWFCDCHISDLWEWAIIVKGDLSILVGAMTTQENLPRLHTKKSKTLVCRYDKQRTQVKVRKPNQFFSMLNRTWGRFVKESTCDSSRRLVPARLIGPLAPQMLLAETKIVHQVVPTWAWCSGLVLSIMLITVASILVRSTLKQLQKVPP